MTTWTAQQQQALDKARRWLDAPAGRVDQVFVLDGYAGTGKSTLAHELNAHVGGRALACAYTGKAASVMASKGLPGATTLHRLIYTPTGGDGEKHLKELRDELALLLKVKEPGKGVLMRLEAVRRQLREAEQRAGQPSFMLRAREDCDVPRAPLVILDERSMLADRQAEDLLSYGTRVLMLGDPAQLPPVRGQGWSKPGGPDALLTEVHRQAQDSGIVRLATDVREGRSIGNVEYGEDAQVVRHVSAREALAADQLLCGTNNKRRAINRRNRDLMGHTGDMPRAGEKLVCLKNDHEEGLLNGTQWCCTQDVEWEPGEEDIHLRVRPIEGGAEMGFRAEASIFIDEDQKPKWGGAQQFTWGSCMTTHKAQGSQWDNLIVFDESDRFRADARRWLYTAVTRAVQRLTVVRT